MTPDPPTGFSSVYDDGINKLFVRVGATGPDDLSVPFAIRFLQPGRRLCCGILDSSCQLTVLSADVGHLADAGGASADVRRGTRREGDTTRSTTVAESARSTVQAGGRVRFRGRADRIRSGARLAIVIASQDTIPPGRSRCADVSDRRVSVRSARGRRRHNGTGAQRRCVRLSPVGRP